MRILSINTVDSGGGAAAVALSLHKEYLRRRLDSHLLVGAKSTDTTNTHELFRLRYGDKRLERSLLGRLEYLTGFQGRFSRALRRWRNKSRGSHWDIVHCHNLHGSGYVSFSDLEAFAPDVPMVVTAHDLWLLSGHCAQPLACKGYKTGCGQCPNLGTYPRVRVDRTAENARRKLDFFHRRKPTLVGVSKWTTERFAESHLGWPCRTIPNGIDTSKFRPRPKESARSRLGLPQRDVLALFVSEGGLGYGGPNTFKRADLVVNTCKLVHRYLASTGRNFQLLVVGGDPPEGQIAPDFVRLMGRVERGLSDLYSAVDVTVHASHAETFGLVVAESMACGTPVVVTESGALPEVIVEGSTGYSVPTGSDEVTRMAESICRVLESDANEFADQARRHIIENFTLERMADAYLELYEELSGRARRVATL